MAKAEEEMIASLHSAVAGTPGMTMPSAQPLDTTIMETMDDEAKRRLRSMLDRAITLGEKKKELNGDLKDIFQEAKSAGYSRKEFALMLKYETESMEDKTKREAAEITARSILAALGDFASSPLGESAVARSRH